MCETPETEIVLKMHAAAIPPDEAGLIELKTLDDGVGLTDSWQLTSAALLDCRQLEKRLARMVVRIAQESRVERRHEAALSLLATIALPNTFVPGRNLLFLTFAAAIAYRRGLKHVVTGVCETDYSGYPDCRDDTIKALQVAINLGMESRHVLETPLMWIDKAQTWALADDLGGPDLVELIRAETLTCYKGDVDTMNPWGRGCGDCPACELRASGFDRWRAGGI